MTEQTRDTGPPTAEFRLTEDELGTALGFVFDRHLAVKKGAREERAFQAAFAFFVPIGVTMSGMFVILLLERPLAARRFTTAMMLGAGLGVVFLLLMLANGRRDTRRAMYVANRKRQLQRLFPWRYRVAIGPEGLTFVNDDGTAINAWSSIRAVTDEGGYILLHTRNRTAYVVPRTAFATPSDADAFLATARAHISESKPTARARDFLSINSAKCPACGHDLRGTEDDLCPECGTVVDLSKIRGLDD